MNSPTRIVATPEQVTAAAERRQMLDRARTAVPGQGSEARADLAPAPPAVHIRGGGLGGPYWARSRWWWITDAEYARARAITIFMGLVCAVPICTQIAIQLAESGSRLLGPFIAACLVGLWIVLTALKMISSS